MTLIVHTGGAQLAQLPPHLIQLILASTVGQLAWQVHVFKPGCHLSIAVSLRAVRWTLLDHQPCSAQSLLVPVVPQLALDQCR